jgi:acyl-CoA synthetase (NDP forming)
VVPILIRFERFMVFHTSTSGGGHDFRSQVRNKPIVTVLLGGKEWLGQVKGLSGETIAAVSSPEAAAKALGALARISRMRSEE